MLSVSHENGGGELLERLSLSVILLAEGKTVEVQTGITCSSAGSTPLSYLKRMLRGHL